VVRGVWARSDAMGRVRLLLLLVARVWVRARRRCSLAGAPLEPSRPAGTW
jgi:hypothetical protein